MAATASSAPYSFKCHLVPATPARLTAPLAALQHEDAAAGLVGPRLVGPLPVFHVEIEGQQGQLIDASLHQFPFRPGQLGAQDFLELKQKFQGLAGLQVLNGADLHDRIERLGGALAVHTGRQFFQ